MKKQVMRMIAAMLAAICATAPMPVTAANEGESDVFTVSSELFSYTSYIFHDFRQMTLKTDATDANWLVAGKGFHYYEDGELMNIEYFLVALDYQTNHVGYGVLYSYPSSNNRFEYKFDDYEIGDLLYFRDVSTVEVHPTELEPENGEIRFAGHGTDVLGKDFEKVIRHEFTIVPGRYFNVTTVPVIYGDLNEDEEVTIMDVVTLNKSLLGGHELSDYSKLAADVDQNGEVNAVDALNTLKYVVGMIDSFE